MSGILSNLVQTILIRPSRTFGVLVPNCAIEEEHLDRLAITEHPVEQGAAITDHAYKLPPEVTIRYGWSNSSAANALASGFGPLGVLGFGSESYAREVYAYMLQMQVKRIPFSMTTGKRVYQNMLIESLSTRTTEETEYAFIADAVCRQIILTQVRVTSVPKKEDQKEPQQTAPPEPLPQQQPAPRPSLLFQGGRVLGGT